MGKLQICWWSSKRWNWGDLKDCFYLEGMTSLLADSITSVPWLMGCGLLRLGELSLGWWKPQVALQSFTWIPWNLSFRYILFDEKKTPNDAVTPQCQSQFTPKMKANAVPRLLSSLVWIDHYNECNGMTGFMEFMIYLGIRDKTWAKIKAYHVIFLLKQPWGSGLISEIRVYPQDNTFWQERVKSTCAWMRQAWSTMLLQHDLFLYQDFLAGNRHILSKLTIPRIIF